MGGGQAGQAAIPLASSPGATLTPLSTTTTTVMAPPLMSPPGRAAAPLPTTHRVGPHASLQCRMVSAALVVSTPLVDVPGMRQQVSESACTVAVAMFFAHLPCMFQTPMQPIVSVSKTVWQCSQSLINNVILQPLLLGDNVLFESHYTSLRHCHPPAEYT